MDDISWYTVRVLCGTVAYAVPEDPRPLLKSLRIRWVVWAGLGWSWGIHSFHNQRVWSSSLQRPTKNPFAERGVRGSATTRQARKRRNPLMDRL
jgi:hypothetical protein